MGVGVGRTITGTWQGRCLVEEGKVGICMLVFDPKAGEQGVRTPEGKAGAWVVIWDKGGKDVGSWSCRLRRVEWDRGGQAPRSEIVSRCVALLDLAVTLPLSASLQPTAFPEVAHSSCLYFSIHSSVRFLQGLSQVNSSPQWVRSFQGGAVSFNAWAYLCFLLPAVAGPTTCKGGSK